MAVMPMFMWLGGRFLSGHRKIDMKDADVGSMCAHGPTCVHSQSCTVVGVSPTWVVPRYLIQTRHNSCWFAARPGNYVES